MAKVLPGATDLDKLHALCELPYKEQVVWFLNAYWEEFASNDAEKMWAYVEKCAEIDLQRGKEGSGLDELQAHVFLEKFDEALTVRDLRTKLRETGAIGENERPKVVPLTHYLLFKYNVNWHQLVHASQGDNSKEIAEAQRMLEAVQAAFQESDLKAKEAAEALREATRSEAEAKQRESTARAAEEEALAREAAAREQEAPFKAAQEELEAALAELKAQEESYAQKKAQLEKASQEGGVVQRNKAANELAQLLAEDPLPLRRAKITAEAAHKKAEKARAPFEAATKEAEAARQNASATAAEATAARTNAEKARKASEDAKAAADHALDEAAKRVDEAEAYLTELKSRPGSAHGSMWWMDRELHEAKKFLPESRGGIRRK